MKNEIKGPILRGRDIKKYGYVYANLYVITTFPALEIDIEIYPSIKKHLLSFGMKRLEQTGKTYNINGETIVARKKATNKWFETQDTIGYWEDFFKQKIIWGEISDRTKFAFDETGSFFSEATTFLMTGQSLPYLACFLNSALSEYLFTKIGTTTGVGTIRWKKFKIEQLLIPAISKNNEMEFESLLCEVMNKNTTAEKRSEIESQIDRRIFEICGLNKMELAHIQRVNGSL